jgi:hypothetical protein
MGEVDTYVKNITKMCSLIIFVRDCSLIIVYREKCHRSYKLRVNRHNQHRAWDALTLLWIIAPASDIPSSTVPQYLRADLVRIHAEESYALFFA